MMGLPIARSALRVAAAPFFALSLLAAAPASAQVDFTSPRSFDASSDPDGLAVADLDGDGLSDLVLSDGLQGAVAVMLGRGLGRFAPPIVRPLADPGQLHRRGLAIGDFDRDGLVDAAIPSLSPPRIHVLFGDALGAFGRVLSYDAVPFPVALASADLDADGDLDVAAANDSGNSVALYAGDGAGGFSLAGSLAPIASPRSIVAADVNGDGNADLAAASYASEFVALFLGDGSFAFTGSNAGDVASGPVAIAAADLDGNGTVDFVLGCERGRSISVLLGDGAGSFAPVRSAEAPGNPRAIAVLDVSGDAAPDLLVADQAASVRLWTGDGLGFFSLATKSVPTGGFPLAIAAADLNADGATDAAVANFTGGSAAILVADPVARTIVSPVVVVAGAMPDSLLVADFDRDGRPDVAAGNRQGSSVTVASGRGRGAFGPPATFPSLVGPAALATADFDENGWPDVAVASATSGVVALLLDAGGAGFSPPTSFAAAPAGPIRAITSADFDEDSHADLAAIDAATGSIRVLAGDGAGGFGAPRTVSVPNVPTALHAVDFDGDGHADLATGTDAAGIRVLFGDGTGAFPRDAVFFPEAAVAFVSSAEVDRDGRIDLIASDRTGSGRVLVVRGDASLSAAQREWSVATATPPFAVAAADFDRDGIVDLAAAVPDPGAVAIFIGDGRGRFHRDDEFVTGLSAAAIAAVSFDSGGDPGIVAAAALGNSIASLANASRAGDLRRVRRGTVNRGAGVIADVLFVNGGVGAIPTRLVALSPTDAFEIRIDAPPSRPLGPSRFALYAWAAMPTGRTLRTLPRDVGVTSLPTPVSGGGPRPGAIWNNIAPSNPRLGIPTHPSSPAPGVVLSRPNGLRRAVTFYLQGIIIDSGAANGRASVTNGILCEVR